MADLSNLSDEQLEAMLRQKLVTQKQPTTAQPKDNSFLRGVLGGIREPIDRLAERANSVVNLDGLSRSLGMPTASEGAAAGDAMRANNRSTAGQAVGNMVGLAPTMAMKAPAALTGAVEGAILSPEKSLGGVVEDALWGAGSAYLGDKAMRGVANVVSPKINSAVRRLTKEGIPLTPGEIFGGRLKVAEDKMMSVPLLGDAISSARARGQAKLERVAVNKALGRVGQFLPEDKAGRDAVTYAGDVLSDRYQTLVPKLTAKADKTLASRLRFTKSKLNLPPAQAAQFDDVIQRELLPSFDQKTGVMTGKKMKDVEERLNDLATSWAKSDNPFERDLAGGVQEVRGHLLHMLARQNPKAAKELRAINKGWSELVPLENAVNVADGSVTSGRLFQGIKAADKSVRKRGTTRGRTEMGRLALDASEVMSNRTPNSFTADRMMLAGGAGGALAAGSAMVNPAAAIPAGLMVPYLPGAARLTQKALTGRQGKIPKAAAEYIRKIAPYAALGAPPLLVSPAYAQENE